MSPRPDFAARINPALITSDGLVDMDGEGLSYGKGIVAGMLEAAALYTMREMARLARFGEPDATEVERFNLARQDKVPYLPLPGKSAPAIQGILDLNDFDNEVTRYWYFMSDREPYYPEEGKDFPELLAAEDYIPIIDPEPKQPRRKPTAEAAPHA